jgi:hypothetical protein
VSNAILAAAQVYRVQRRALGLVTFSRAPRLPPLMRRALVEAVNRR